MLVQPAGINPDTDPQPPTPDPGVFAGVLAAAVTDYHAAARTVTVADCRGARDLDAAVVISGLAFLQNLRRGHYELAIQTPRSRRIAAAFTELTSAI